MRQRALPFADRVQARLRERGLGLREFCREVGLDPSFFSKVLAGKRSPPSEESDLRRIAAALGVDAASLIVSAGRIPSEWTRLWDDQALFQRVHRLAAGSDSPAALPPPASAPHAVKERAEGGNWRRSPSPAAAPKPFEEELL